MNSSRANWPSFYKATVRERRRIFVITPRDSLCNSRKPKKQVSKPPEPKRKLMKIPNIFVNVRVCRDWLYFPSWQFLQHPSCARPKLGRLDHAPGRHPRQRWHRASHYLEGFRSAAAILPHPGGAMRRTILPQTAIGAPARNEAPYFSRIIRKAVVVRQPLALLIRVGVSCVLFHSSVYLSRAGNPPGPQWKQIGPAPLTADIGSSGPDSGMVRDILIDPRGTTDQTIYVATDSGGIWKSTDGGTNWTPKTDAMPSLNMGAVALDPGNPSIVYAGTGNEYTKVTSTAPASTSPLMVAIHGRYSAQIFLRTLPSIALCCLHTTC